MKLESAGEVINVYIGFDPREAISFSVLSFSIHMRASKPVSITPLMLSQLKGVFKRERDPLQSTDFAFSRFLTPYLSGYKGWSLYIDCDMLMFDDIANLWSLRDAKYAIMVVKHQYEPQETIKFLGQRQTSYERKNWSSVMLFNNERCRALTPEYVNTASGLNLHQFQWLDNEKEIGDLPLRWNHLVGVYAPNADVSLVHFTLGSPFFEEYSRYEYAAEWRAELKRMLSGG